MTLMSNLRYQSHYSKLLTVCPHVQGIQLQALTQTEDLGRGNKSEWSMCRVSRCEMSMALTLPYVDSIFQSSSSSNQGCRAVQCLEIHHFNR